MSGRAYARNPSGTPGGGTDLNSILPHRFRLEAPKAVSKAKELAIRRAIQRQCKEKNWKKLLRMRHTRLLPLEIPSVETETNSRAPDVTSASNGKEDTKETSQGQATCALVPPQAQAELEANVAAVTAEATASLATTKQETAVDHAPVEKDREELERAKQALQEMEERLTTLSHEKHAKFQQLKEILIAEARAKSTPTPTKKRRLDASTSLGMSPRLQASGSSGNEGEHAASSSPLAAGPPLSRAQSYGGTSSVGSSEFTSQDAYNAHREPRYR